MLLGRDSFFRGVCRSLLLSTLTESCNSALVSRELPAFPSFQGCLSQASFHASSLARKSRNVSRNLYNSYIRA